MAEMDRLADRLDAAAAAMIELGPQLAMGEPWALTETYGPGPESEWGPREVLAHCAEMLPYWMGAIELILDGAGGEPATFGRVETDPLRIEVIGRDRTFPSRELLGRIEVEAVRLARRFRELTDAQAAIQGRHVTRGDLSVADVAERLVVSHLEGHVTQLRETLASPH
jgi:hypothetical protein